MRVGEINKDNYTEFSNLINGISKNKNKQSFPINQLSNKETGQNYEPDWSKFKNTHGLTGMVMTEGDNSWKKTIAVSDDIRDKTIEIARKDCIKFMGYTDGVERTAAVVEYLRGIPEQDRLSAAWTLENIYREEATKLHNAIKEKNPDWKPGQAFDPSILDDYLNGVSTSVESHNSIIDKMV